MNPKYYIVTILIAAPLFLASVGCDEQSDSQANTPVDTSDCTPRPPSTTDDTDPGVLHGRVLAPFGKLAAFRSPPAPNPPGHSPIPDWLVGRAEAAPLETERTVANASVHLYRVDSTGARVGENIAQTTSDSGGNWCIRLPNDVTPGPGLMVEARGASADTRLRRNLVAPFATDTFAGTEALTRLLQANRVDFLHMSTESYLNMESIADTRVDLLNPVDLKEQMNLEDAIDHIQQTLAKDPRLIRKIDQAPKSE